VQQGFVSVLWFLGVIALIPVALWLLKRSPVMGLGQHKAGTPRTVALLPLASQHKLVTVEVGQGEDRLWLVLGISPQGIRTLHTMLPQADADVGAAPPPAATFQHLLSRLRRPGSGNDAG
jgi:flagellar protein FliO/FliZ